MPNLALADGALARRKAVKQHFLDTGEYDPKFPAWSGNIIERETKAMADMLQALVAEVKQLSGRIHAPSFPADLVAFTRKKVEPMVRGLFRRDEQETVLAVLEKSLVFLTAANIEQVLLGCTWTHSAWNLANLYLGSMGAPLLGPDAPKIVGLSEETTCYVSLAYFHEGEAFATIVTNHAAVLQDGAELEKKIAQRGAQLTQRLREMEAVKEAEAKANERLERITSLRADLCQTTDSLGRLHAAERFQRRVDQASDTESPYTRRQNAAAVLVLSDRKKKDVQELRSLGADFNVRRDCATVGTGDE